MSPLHSLIKYEGDITEPKQLSKEQGTCFLVMWSVLTHISAWKQTDHLSPHSPCWSWKHCKRPYAPRPGAEQGLTDWVNRVKYLKKKKEKIIIPRGFLKSWIRHCWTPSIVSFLCRRASLLALLSRLAATVMSWPHFLQSKESAMHLEIALIKAAIFWSCWCIHLNVLKAFLHVNIQMKVCDHYFHLKLFAMNSTRWMSLLSLRMKS